MSFSRISAGGILFSVAVVGAGMTAAVQAQQADMTFFVTSVGKGNGADLGGLEGADAHCAALAKAAGAKATSWRAYLSTTLPGGDQGADARSRIGKGPWRNAKGVVVAKSVSDLHSEHNNINKQTALTEKGEMVKGRGDTPNEHDILTGSDPAGMFSTAGRDTTLGQLTQSGGGSADLRAPDPPGVEEKPDTKDLEFLARSR